MMIGNIIHLITYGLIEGFQYVKDSETRGSGASLYLPDLSMQSDGQVIVIKKLMEYIWNF